MVASRHITKIIAVLMALSVALCLCAVAFAEPIVEAMGGVGVTMEYESKLFDTSEVLEINILMDDADWQALLDNAISEEYTACDVEIAGQTFRNVAIRPKGNTSLSSIAMDPDTDRYSFKLEFDQYEAGQSCFGLDKLILNNNYADATNMKEALIYDMFQEIGADASLWNYAKVSVNGEYWGVYLALEAVEDSFLLRNYGAQDGELYKPDSMNMGGGGDRGGGDRGEMPDMGDRDFSNMTPPDAPTDGTQPGMGDFDPSEMFGGGGGGFGGGMFGNGGANLNYTDDDLDSYSTIWEGEVTDSGKSDHRRVVEALKHIDQGTELETYMDVDNLLKYAAVHIFSANSDSLSGSMAHNYYLYESDGQLNLLPWDYNLAFGGMGGGGGRGGMSGATSTVNSAIDNAWQSTNFFDALLADEEYHAAYYAQMQKVVDYIQNGSFETFYTETRARIDALVETDPNAFYTYEEYLTAVETLCEVVTLRGQAIQNQLNGSDETVDASHIDLSVMGSMNMGGGGGFDFGGRGGDRSDQPAQTPKDAPDSIPAETVTQGAVNTSAAGQMPEGFGPSQFTGEMPEGFGPSQFTGEMPENFDPSAMFGGEMPEGFDPSQFAGEMPGNAAQTENGDEAAAPEVGDGGSQNQGRPNMGGWSGGAPQQTGGLSSALISYIIAAVVLLAAFLFALFYRRRPRKR